ncbi:MAG: PIG-L family deacetylase [Acidobacteria bacterium]|nr:PIG-L family deacetylase [Acidobacteriota bacterium]
MNSTRLESFKIAWRHWAIRCAALLTLAAFLSPAPSAAPARAVAAQQRQTLKDLSTAFSLMSVAAHPDDEDAEALTLMRMKWGVRASIVVSNYGEGGQNAIGPELYEDLGAVRTHELRAAADHYGVPRILSLGFVDFGFSKTAEETFRFWGGQDEVVRRLVAAIRKDRPLVIITNHSVDQGHGNHRAVAIALKEAFHLSEQADYHPDLGPPWKALRLFQTQQKPDGAAVILNVGEVEPFSGQTYAEIARNGYLQHASQGPHPVPYIVPRVRYYRLWDSAAGENLSGADNFFSGLAHPYMREIRVNLNVIHKHYATLSAAHLLPDSGEALRQIEQDLKTLGRMRGGLASQFSREKREHLQASIDDLANQLANAKAGVAGLRVTWDLVGVSEAAAKRIETTADIDNLLRSRPVNEAVAGDYALFRIGVATPLDLKFQSASRQWPEGWSEVRTLDGTSARGIWTQYGIVSLSRQAGVTEPFRQYYTAENLPRITWNVKYLAGALQVPFEWSTNPRVFPRAQMVVSPDRWLAWKDQEIAATVRLTNHSAETLRGKLIASSGAQMDIEVAPRRTRTLQLAVLLRRGRAVNEALQFEGEDGARAAAEILVRPGELQIASSVGEVGLVRHSDASTEEALRNLGVPYQVIGQDELLTGDLTRYQTILVDHRSYVLVPELVENNDRLMDFARNGGTLVVFYQRAAEFNVAAGYPQLTPYPLRVSSMRVSVEEAPVRFLVPDHPLLRQPNEVGPAEFAGWVQERGLYYPDQWDTRYQALLSCNDPGEQPLDGGLLVAPVGKGAYIYTTYVWYRQWKELSNGAFRMLANLLSYNQPQ